MNLDHYWERVEAEAKTGHPAQPCPHCGHDSWSVERPWRRSKSDRPCLFPAICGHCGVMETAHHVDGVWTGRQMESGSWERLFDFVGRRSEELRAEDPGVEPYNKKAR